MTYSAGQRVQGFNLPSPSTAYAVGSTGLTTSSATYADIVGATVTFNTVNSTAVVLVFGVSDISFNTQVAGAVATFQCVVDGNAQTSVGVFECKQTATNTERATVAQNWQVALATPGSHTIKLQGAVTSAATAAFRGTQTTLTVLILDF